MKLDPKHYPAFPTEHIPNFGETPDQRAGLTKVDYFTAKAMQGLLSNPKYAYLLSVNNDNVLPDVDIIAKLSVDIAEATIKELGKIR